MPIPSKSQQPPQSLPTLSPNPPKGMSKQTEHMQINVISDSGLKMTFYLNVLHSAQGLWPGGAAALQPRILKCFTASATRVAEKGAEQAGARLKQGKGEIQVD